MSNASWYGESNHDNYQSYNPYGGYQQHGGVNPSYFVPSSIPDSAHIGMKTGDSFENQDELPLLEELGFNGEHILQKTLAVLNPFRATRSDVAGDSDLAGPLVFCLVFGALLLLTGKVYFNYIYVFGAFGCLAMYALLYLMALSHVSPLVVVSVLGYCILPIVVLSALSVVISLKGILGNLCAIGAVLWCALSASKLFITAFNMEKQQFLIAYPCALFYGVFALLAVF